MLQDFLIKSALGGILAAIVLLEQIKSALIHLITNLF